MKLKLETKYKLVYSINTHPFLGDIIEPYAVKLNEEDHPTLDITRIYSNTAESYICELTENDKYLIRQMDDYSIESIAKKFQKGNLRPMEFFKQKVDNKFLNQILHPFIDKIISKCMERIYSQKIPLYLKGETDDPMREALEILEEPASILFHFIKNDEGTRYYPTIKHNDELVKFVNNNSRIICQKPCWLLVGNKVYHFDAFLDGKKLVPFLEKFYIQINQNSEQAYFSKFVLPLVEQYKVRSEGFEIRSAKLEVKPQLVFSLSLEGSYGFELNFIYGDKKIYHNDKRTRVAIMKPNNSHFDFQKSDRDLIAEKKIIKILKDKGLNSPDNVWFYLDDYDQYRSNNVGFFLKNLEWVNYHYNCLEESGFSINKELELSKQYFVGRIELDLSIKKSNDWFDILGYVFFGEFKIPFLRLRNYIIKNIREYPLPNGEIAILPEEWFERFHDIFALGKGSKSDDTEKLMIRKHHFHLLKPVTDISKDNKELGIEKLKSLDEKKRINVVDMPKNFKAKLRSYQLTGYQWINFLRENSLGGCLADDMGLGKTIQTLCVLAKQKELLQNINNENASKKDEKISYGPLFEKDKKSVMHNDTSHVSLIIMPASLVHNWKNEARKFAPQLRVLEYTGLERREKLNVFHHFDLVLSTYGTVRNDIDLLEKIVFNYVILDESQVIKNHASKVFRAVRRLQAHNKLALTGTPIENSLTDLWSQMSFLNPGLLGGFKFFKKRFVAPIEKKEDKAAQSQLRKIIEPFILRRTKSEVAKELPTLTQEIYYCEMTEDQKKFYEETKSKYRNEILANIDKFGLQKSQFLILKGLIELRQISNHPVLVDKTKAYTSGKFKEIIRTIESVVEEGHKILVFSQFVKHLELFRNYFDKSNTKYSYLVGSTKNREKVITEFTKNKDVKLFLISLKAGGSGLNLTSADYVFMLDPWWNPAAENQAINRAHRIGQDKKVFSYKFITKNSIEEKILALQKRKSRLSKSLIQTGKNFNRFMDKNDIEELLE